MRRKPGTAGKHQLNGNAPCPGATFRVITPDKIPINNPLVKFRQRARLCRLRLTTLLFHAMRTFTHQGNFVAASLRFGSPCCLFLFCSLLPIRLTYSLCLQCAGSVRAEKYHAEHAEHEYHAKDAFVCE